MKIKRYIVWRYAVYVLIGECIGLGLVALFLYHSSFDERIPDMGKLVIVVGSFVALFLFAMSHRPRAKG